MGKKSLYIPALDGLRAFAVIAVILYHLDPNYLPSGLLGVTVFFVLSGYLITGLLVKEWRQTGRIDLPQFWLRRARRLLPAVLLVVMATAAVSAFVAPDLLTKLRDDLLAALLFFTNWHYILSDTSYFDALGAPSPVTHFWSLAIEEQFYLIWPPILYLLMGRRIKFRAIRRGLLVAAVASAAAMALLYDPAGDPSRVYYGTDTRAFSLLIGAWLSFVFPAERFRMRPKGAASQAPSAASIFKRTFSGRGPVPKEAKGVINLAGTAALIGMIAMMVFVDGYSGFLYYGGIALLSVLTAACMLALLNPGSALERVFSWAPFVWIGKLSYGIYLWHYPVFLLMTDQNSTSDISPLYQLAMVLVVLLVSFLSYSLVENPLRHGAIGKIIARIRDGEITLPQALLSHAVQIACAIALTATAAIGLIVTPDTSTIDGPNGIYQNDENGEGGLASGDEGVLPETGYDTLLIGDSVTLAAVEQFPEYFPNGLIDAKINRWFMAAPRIYGEHVAAGWQGENVIFCLGTNGPIELEEVENTYAQISPDQNVFLVNNRMPESWRKDNNALLASFADSHENVTLIDWYSYSAGHDNWFAGDGTHIGQTGARAYLELLDAHVNPPINVDELSGALRTAISPGLEHAFDLSTSSETSS